VSIAAAVFPGQGSQRVGMARDFYDSHAASRRVFAEASDALGYDAAKLCFDDAERLARTEFQQPAILTAEIAMLAALREGFGFTPAWFGGHSLGEYSALVAAGVIDIGQAAVLVRERGRLMQEVVPLGEGGMSAILMRGLDVARLRALLAESEPIEVDVANENSPDQVVLSGNVRELARAAERLKDDPTLARARAIPLRVSAPFHSRLMRPAAERFRPLLEEASARWRPDNAARVTSNLLGAVHAPERTAIVDALARQIFSPVLWLDCMRVLDGACARIVEVAPSRTLAGFFKGIDATIESVTDVASAASAFAP
jgi:[acyl-carrier-protein] S-malonyltransferase